MTQSRRRGAVLEEALYLAAVAEMAEVGYTGMTVEGVAARAKTGKAAVYRRWPNKHALALDALRYVLPPPPELDLTIPARDNLRQIFTTLSGAFAGDNTEFPGLAVMLGVLGDPQLRAAFVDAIVLPRLTVIAAILARAEQTGEVAPGALAPLAAKVGPSLIMQTILLTGEPPTPADLEAILDTVLPGPGTRSARRTVPRG
ncbi:MAG TPA: TetR/AcrR family transcriptional regulator [Pseudonocardiaceae bacterium]|nr:TetR/AcrR family transcriptional regulator [Pseudonocardiaceae bacterium]